jgi:hypothetical protein
MTSVKCYCNELAYSYIKYAQEGDKIVKYQIANCDRSILEKKKKRCEMSMCEIIGTTDIPVTEKPKDTSIETGIKNDLYTRENLIKELYRCISIIHDYHSNKRELSFEKYVNKILHISHFLNIPPYIQEKVTIEEYYNIVCYRLNKPILNKPNDNKLKLPIKFIEGFDDILRMNSPVISKKHKKIKSSSSPTHIPTHIPTTIKVGDIMPESDDDSDDDDKNSKDNEFDVENFDSDDEEEVNMDDYSSD